MLDKLKEELNYTKTENGAVTHKSTLNECLDFFGLAGAMRSRPDDALILFQKAFNQDRLTAVRLLFYFRDIRGGQGERQLFRNCLHWLADQTQVPVVISNLFPFVVEHGRWDDLYAFVDTQAETEMFSFMKNQFMKDLKSETPSLLAKWMKSENTSSKKSVALGKKTRVAFGMRPRDYRKLLSSLRAKINVLETLMSAGKWEDIDFNKLPAKASILYRKAFEKRQPVRYQDFIDSMKTGEVKAKSATLYPYEIVEKLFSSYRHPSYNDMIYFNSAWENLPNYLQGDTSRAIAVVDTSGSMHGNPINVALSLGLYMAERNEGHFADHFITFSSDPELIKINKSVDLYHRLKEMRYANWRMNTNLEAVFDLLLNTAIKHKLPPEELPETLYIISDMEFDSCVDEADNKQTLMDSMEIRWRNAGYELPRLVFWNVNARQEQFPKIDGNVTLVSGLSPAIFTSTVKNLSPIDTMTDALKKYSNIYI